MQLIMPSAATAASDCSSCRVSDCLQQVHGYDLYSSGASDLDDMVETVRGQLTSCLTPFGVVLVVDDVVYT